MAAHKLVVKTSQTVFSTGFRNVRLISFCRAISMDDSTSPRIKNLSYTLPSLVTGASVLTGILRAWSSLIPACLSFWAVSTNVDVQAFGCTAPTAALVQMQVVSASPFSTVWKGLLSERSARSGPLFPSNSYSWRDLVDRSCKLVFSFLQQWYDESVCAEQQSVLGLVTGQF